MKQLIEKDIILKNFLPLGAELTVSFHLLIIYARFHQIFPRNYLYLSKRLIEILISTTFIDCEVNYFNYGQMYFITVSTLTLFFGRCERMLQITNFYTRFLPFK